MPGLEQSQGLHNPDFGIDLISSQLAQQQVQVEPTSSVAQDDEFMAKIDDTLGPWQPDSESHFQ